MPDQPEGAVAQKQGVCLTRARTGVRSDMPNGDFDARRILGGFARLENQQTRARLLSRGLMKRRTRSARARCGLSTGVLRGEERGRTTGNCKSQDKSESK